MLDLELLVYIWVLLPLNMHIFVFVLFCFLGLLGLLFPPQKKIFSDGRSQKI